MKRRLFVGIKISEELQEKILSWEKSWWEKLTVRWLTPKNLHLTLIPPWYEEDIGQTKSNLTEIQGKISPFEIEFNKVTLGPNPKNPRLIWAEGQTPPEIIKLKNLLNELLHQKSEKRPFQLHLTLARFKPQDFRFFTVKRLDEKISWGQEVNLINLFEAHLSLTGAEYEILGEIKF